MGVLNPTASHAGPSSPPAYSSENIFHSPDSFHFPNLSGRVSHSDLWFILPLLQQRTQLQFPRWAIFGQRGARGFGQQARAHCRLLQRLGRRLQWLLLHLRLTWVRISVCARVEPVLLGRLLLLVLLHLQQLLLLVLGPCSPFQHGHSDSRAAKQQRVRGLSLPELPVLVPVQLARAGKL